MPDNNNQGTNYPVDKKAGGTARQWQQEDNADNPVTDEEAQNVTDGSDVSAVRRQRRR